jgi:BMFP domain-containing protein YqiC
MHTPHLSAKPALSRRAFLRGAGTLLALPWLDAMLPAFATRAQAATATAPPRRFIAMNYGLGFHGPHLFPKQAGRDYELTPYLEPLKEHRADFSIVSGLSHVEQNGANGHTSELTWLTTAKHPGLPGFKNSISLDQFLIEKLAPDTRFSSLILNVNGPGDSLSWTANGVNLPAESSPSKVFAQLFVSGSPAEVQAQMRELKRGRSILDTVNGEAKKLERDLGARDREKLDQYLTSVRDLETRLHASEKWAQRPKPAVTAKPPTDIQDRTDILARTRLMHDLMVLALQTDSTRFITYKAGGMNAVPKIEGVDQDWHNLSHHGQEQEKISELKLIELAEFREIARFLGLLKGVKEGNRTLLDQTIVMAGSNLGNASSHSWRDIPVLLAGGGFKHGQHVVAGGTGNDNARFGNLFVQIAQRLDVGIDRFGTSNGTSLKGLELA